MYRQSLCLAVAACLVPGLARADEEKADAWKTFSSKDGKFSVLLPGTPQEHKQPGNPAIGQPELRSFTLAPDTDRVFVVSYSDYPRNVLEDRKKRSVLLESMAQGIAKSFKGKLLSSKEITLGKGKHPGREALIEMPEKKHLYRARLFLVGTRLYQVVALGPEAFTKGKEGERYLDSFKAEE